MENRDTIPVMVRKENTQKEVNYLPIVLSASILCVLVPLHSMVSAWVTAHWGWVDLPWTQVVAYIICGTLGAWSGNEITKIAR